MTDEFVLTENGYYFTDTAAPDIEIESYGDLGVPPVEPFAVPDAGATTLTAGKVTQYEDADVLLNYFVYTGDKLVSYLETTKATGVMIQYTYVRTLGAPAEPVGSNEDYQNFAQTGEIDDITDDVGNENIENYDVIETLIASIGPGGVLIPA
jgi:hypothetical protein